MSASDTSIGVVRSPENSADRTQRSPMQPRNAFYTSTNSTSMQKPLLKRAISSSSSSSSIGNSPNNATNLKPQLRVHTGIDPDSISEDYTSQTDSGEDTINRSKRLWVRKKSGGAATSLIVHAGEIIDDVKTRILERYPTSLLLKCDPADLVLTVQTRSGIRLELQPDEQIIKVIDKYFPKGMKMNDAVEVGPPVANWGSMDKGSSVSINTGSRSASRSSIRAPRGQSQQPQQSQQSQSQQSLQSLQSLQSQQSQQSQQSLQSQQSQQSQQYPTPVATSAPLIPNGVLSPNNLMPFPSVISASKPSSPVDALSPVDTYKISPHTLRREAGSRNDSNASNVSIPSNIGRRVKRSNTNVLLLPKQLATGASNSNTSLASNHNTSTNSMKSLHNRESNLEDGLVSPLLANNGFNDRERLATQFNRFALRTPGFESHSNHDDYTRKEFSGSLWQLQQKISPSIQISQEGKPIIVPQIKVLIVEDNPINQRLLEAFMKRKKVRYGVAKNGREALEMWKAGGYHLIFMDIQLPVMTGLEATKEIRRLEVVNGIGTSHSYKQPTEIPAEDIIMKSAGGFRSPVIIVALTASNDKDDKSDALAAGCNDFLTKPVSFSWLEKKIIEWGCMQALIDFDGWKTWNDNISSESIAAVEGNNKLALDTPRVQPVEST